MIDGAGCPAGPCMVPLAVAEAELRLFLGSVPRSTSTWGDSVTQLVSPPKINAGGKSIDVKPCATLLTGNHPFRRASTAKELSCYHLLATAGEVTC